MPLPVSLARCARLLVAVVVAAAGFALGGGCVDDGAPKKDCGRVDGWRAGESAFTEKTEALGLTGVEGQRVSAVDLDGDGAPDLIVRKTNAGPNDTSADLSARTAWILHNEIREGRGFVDVSASSGLFLPVAGQAAGRPGEVIAFADVDNDGDLDAFFGVDTADGNNFGEVSEIYLNRVKEPGALTFERVDGGDVRRAGQPDFPASAVFFDFDHDGNVDLFVPESSYGSSTLEFVGDRLYKGDGTGVFHDVTEQMGLTSKPWVSLADLNDGLAFTRSWSGAACDLDGSGDPALLVGSYGRSPNHLWQKNGGAFANVSVASGYAYDDDKTFADNQMFDCFCAQSPAPNDENCQSAASPEIQCSSGMWDPSTDEQPFRLGGNNAAALCADLDNDGKVDVVTTTIKHWWAGESSDAAEILKNVTADGGDVRFTRPGRDKTGISVDHLGRVDWDEGIMTGAVFDFDNDGKKDIYLGGSDYPGNRGMLFHNESDASGLHFAAVDTADFFEHNRSHGIAVADFDGDGDLDVVVGHSLARCDASQPNDCYPTANVRYFENTVGNRAHWLQLHLVGGDGSNRAAIGARVTVSAGGVTQVQDVAGGFGHFGAENDLLVHFGLGGACDADVTVRWPDAQKTTQRFHVDADRRVTVEQGSAPRPVD